MIFMVKRIKFVFIPLLLLSHSLNAQGFICAIGGGSEDYNDWSNKPYSWIVQKADSGKIIILGVSDASEWLPQYFKSLGAREVRNKKISSAASADSQSTYDEIASARAVFIRGGDQYNYIRYWKGTKTEEAIKQVFYSGGVVAGTSAGAAVLGSMDFSARTGSAYPRESLQNPFYNRIQLEDNFLNLVPGVIFDTHVMERGRQGRLIAFIFNAYFTASQNLRGIGLDDKTAFCIDNNGMCKVYGTGAVTIFRKDENTIYQRESNSYVIQGLHSDQLIEGWSYDLITDNVIPRENAREILPVKTSEFPSAEIWFSGNDSVEDNLNFGLKEFIAADNQFLVMFDPGSASRADAVSLSIASAGNSVQKFELNSVNNNDEVYCTRLSSAVSIIIAGGISAVRTSLDKSSLAGKILHDKVLSGNTRIYFTGNSGRVSGSYYIDKVDDNPLASYRGLMTLNTGLSFFDNLIFQPLLYEDPDFYENRVSALLYGIMRTGSRYGIYLDGSGYLKYDPAKLSLSGSGSLPFFLIDESGSTLVDSSVYVSGSGYKQRQVIGINNLRCFISNTANEFLLKDRVFSGVVSVQSEINTAEFLTIEELFPNPFNSGTQLNFHLAADSYVMIKIYDIMGAEVKTSDDTFYSKGSHTIRIDGKNLSSGIYFCHITVRVLQGSKYSTMKRLVYLK